MSLEGLLGLFQRVHQPLQQLKGVCFYFPSQGALKTGDFKMRWNEHGTAEKYHFKDCRINFME